MGLCVSKPRTTSDYNTYASYNSGPSTPEHEETGSSRITEAHPEFRSIPDRAKDKAIALKEALSRQSGYILPRLEHYARTALSQAAHIGSTPEITDLDIENIGYLTDTYNQRLSNINLKHHTSPQNFFQEFMTSQEPCWRSVVRLSPNSRHHVAIDVRNQDDVRTMLIIESALAYGKSNNATGFMPGYLQMHNNVKNYAQDNGHMAVIQLGAQKSKYDCIIFSLNNALAAYQKDAIFDSLHDSLRENGSCFQPGEYKSDTVSGIEVIDGTKILPAVFFKHAHSRSTINDAIEEQPELADRNVSTNRESAHQTLSERVADFRVQRSERSYSMSIESSRLRKIRKAIES
ncbi:hypothetical protein ALQ27_200184 [Pseudomonas syringae pv. delphinii]|nr:YopJ family type III secretion system effector XopJ [Pseudomonas syringae group genomosp. 3]KPX19572.1 hypothetical protein ALO72_200215 [Pseudomonas syringae pv. delphinii]RMP24392.1 hypothetical protein ALQ27_200184 [Pseudomonas syringae pv. delphinii]